MTWVKTILCKTIKIIYILMPLTYILCTPSDMKWQNCRRLSAIRNITITYILPTSTQQFRHAIVQNKVIFKIAKIQKINVLSNYFCIKRQKQCTHLPNNSTFILVPESCMKEFLKQIAKSVLYWPAEITEKKYAGLETGQPFLMQQESWNMPVQVLKK